MAKHLTSETTLAQHTLRLLPIIPLLFLMSASLAQPGRTQDQNWKLCNGEDPERSIAACSALIQSGQETGSNLASAYYSRGLGYGRQADYDHSISDYDQALRLNPNFPEALYRRGNCFAHKGDYDRAIEDYDQALGLKPSEADFFYARGVSYARKRNYDRAFQDYDQALRLKPNFPNAFYARGVANQRKHQYEFAIQDYDQAIRLNANFPAAFYARSLAYAHQAHYFRAMADYGRSRWLELGPFGFAIRSFCVLVLIAGLLAVVFRMSRKREVHQSENELPPEEMSLSCNPRSPEMPDAELVVVKTVGNRLEAELAKSTLRAASIDAIIKADTAGGMRDHLAWGDLGFQILVRREDAPTAQEVLTPLDG